jgi:hypothetical protein
VCDSGETCSSCPADCNKGNLICPENTFAVTLSSGLVKSGCSGDGDGDCLDDVQEAALATAIAPWQLRDEDESCDGRKPSFFQTLSLGDPVKHYKRKDFFQVRPETTPGQAVASWASDTTSTKWVAVTYFLFYPADCADSMWTSKDGHQGDSEHVIFYLASYDDRTWFMQKARYYHHAAPYHEWKGDWLKRLANDNQTAYPSVLYTQNSHGSFPGLAANRDDCAGWEDDNFWGSNDCCEHSKMSRDIHWTVPEATGVTANIGEPTDLNDGGRWNTAQGVISLDANGKAYNAYDTGHGGPQKEYWSDMTGTAQDLFCGWECPNGDRSIQSGSGGYNRCAYDIHHRKRCADSVWSKLDRSTMLTGVGCGNGVCEGPESSSTCPSDCGAVPLCGDGVCGKDENPCNCPADCGAPTAEVPNGIDDDCNGIVDDGVAGVEACGDRRDNDQSGQVDNGPCVFETLCNDGVDNDGDGLVDGADPNCCGESSCKPTMGSAYASQFAALDCSGTEYYYTPYFSDGNHHSWDGKGIGGTTLRTATVISWKGSDGRCHNDWPSGNTLGNLVTVYRIRHCGDGTCEPGESPANCLQDCSCGNGVCDNGETCESCAKDCGVCDAASLCTGTAGMWSGCRGNGCSVCTEKVAAWPKYFVNNPGCSPNASCGGLYYTCNSRCPPPTDRDLGDGFDATGSGCGNGICDGGESCSSCARDCGTCPSPSCQGTSGQWSGCRGNGCSVCIESISAYTKYMVNHPGCVSNANCGAEYYTCNSSCPAPTSADL